MGILEIISALLEAFLNVLELIAIIVSIFTFFFLMFNKYNKALKIVLAPLGLNFRARIKALMICRKSTITKRAFLEFCILKTQGYGVTYAEWRTILNEFKTFMSASNDLIYTIPNCTALIGEDFALAIERYFRFIGQPKIKKALGIQDDQLKWVIRLHIEEAYATPTCLLTGLLSMYEENWEEFIKRYVSTAYMTEADEDPKTSVLPNELYFTFAWLLWGPSYELNYKKGWDGLCQLSFGDESNSIPAIANRNSAVYESMQKKFEENTGRRYGALLSADISLYEKKKYYSVLRSDSNPENLYFFDKIEAGGLPFAAQIDNFTPYTNYKSKKYYCTAYVWLLFEVESDSYQFQPERSVAFFEHANITERTTYSFLVETLIEKSLAHFKKIFEDEKYNGRTYRFVCALNSTVEEECITRYKAIMNDSGPFSEALRNRVFLQPKRLPIAAFSAFDEFFARNGNLTFEDINYENKQSITDLGLFYTDIYMESFPDQNEREEFDNLLTYLRKSKDSTGWQFHIVLAKDENNKPIAGCIFDYFPSTNAGMIEFLAVKNDLQSAGIGTALYKHVLQVLEKDAYTAGKKRLNCVFCEIDSPEHSRANIKKYLYFWHKHGYKHLDFQYIQPALSQNQQPVDGLWLNIMPLNIADDKISGEYILRVLADYMNYCMQIPDYRENAQYKKMEREIGKKDKISLLNIL